MWRRHHHPSRIASYDKQKQNKNQPTKKQCLGDQHQHPRALLTALTDSNIPMARTIQVYIYYLRVCLLSHVQLFGTPWTVACQAPLSMGFSREEYWSGLPFPSPGELPDPGIESGSPACGQILYHLSYWGGPGYDYICLKQNEEYNVFCI